MEPYRISFSVTPGLADRAGHLKPSAMLYFAQEAAGKHCSLLGVDRQALEPRHLFWAVIRHKAEISRLPRVGETVTVETWPMPTTRSAYPRSTVGYDAQGNPLFRIISLWVLMDTQTRAMVLPGKSGITVDGILQGGELTPPASIPVQTLPNTYTRTIRPEDLDENLHMNNTRYLEWVWELLPQTLLTEKTLQGFTICYLSEARQDESLTLSWGLSSEGNLHLEGHRQRPEAPGTQARVFAVQMTF